MKKMAMGAIAIIICIVGVVVVFSQKPVSVKPDFDSETKESNVASDKADFDGETEESNVTSNKADFDSETKVSNAANEYDILWTNGYDKLDDLFRNNKETFVSAADLLLAKNSNGLMVSYDLENNSIDDIFIGNKFYSIKDSFTDAEQEILENCFDIMHSMMLSDTRCLMIDVSERFGGSVIIDFMFRSKLDMDYGISFVENESGVVGEFSKLEDNWYKFIVGLV